MKKVIIIGSGPAGYPAALKLKALGADVKIVENWTFGGTCLNRGCIPSKAIIEIGHRYHNIKEIKDFFEGNIDFKPKWDKIKEHKNKVVTNLRTSLEKLFTIKKIEVIRGSARILSDKKIEVENNGTKNEHEFDNLIIATGTKPSYPPPFEQFRDFLTDSDKVFDLEKKPEKLIIVGAGVIGIEMACFFNSIGTDVSVIDIMPNILPFEDESVTRVLKQSLEKRNIKFYLGVKTKEIKINGSEKTIILDNGSELKADEIMVAAGRTADLKRINLEAAQIKYGKFIEVNEYMQSSNQNIYAVGDVNGISLLAHSATRQGEISALNIMGHREKFDKNIVPNCIYSFPEVASVGIRLKEAKEKNINVKTKKAFFQVLGKAVATFNTEGFIQIITDENEVILGAQIIGGPATEIIHILSIAVKFKMKASELNSIIYAHPTMSEIIMEALKR